MEHKNQKRKLHVNGLDGLRGIAILGVIFYHLMPGKVPGGFLGVNMFFVISGYLIYRTSVWDLCRGEYSISAFYKRRCKRIFPSLIVMVCAVMLALLFFLPGVANGKTGEILSIFTGYNNLWQIHQNASYFARMSQQSPFTHLWAIAVEMQFYVIWPLLFMVMRWLKKHISREGVKFFLVIAVVVTGLWMSILYQPNQDVSRLYYGTDTRMFALLLGVLTAMIQKDFQTYCEHRMAPWIHNLLLFGMMGLYIILYFFVEGQMPYVYLGGLFANGILCAVIILVLLSSSFAEIMERTPFTVIGKISYELYLWMYPIIFLFGYYKKNYGFIYWSLQLIFIFLVAAIQYLIMKRFRRERNANFFCKVKYVTCNLIMVFIVLFASIGICNRIPANFSYPHQNQVNAEKQAEPMQRIPMVEDKGKKMADHQQEEKHTVVDKKKSIQKSMEEQATDRKITAIGDSVLLGADKDVEQQIPNCIVNAKESRQVYKTKAVVEELKENGELGDVVILALGTNGTFSSSVGKKLVQAIGSERQIYWVTVYGQHLQWQEDSNYMIWSMAEKYPNVHVIDWAALGEKHPEWFIEDGVHLTQSGCEAYAKLLRDSVSP